MDDFAFLAFNTTDIRIASHVRWTSTHGLMVFSSTGCQWSTCSWIAHITANTVNGITNFSLSTVIVRLTANRHTSNVRVSLSSWWTVALASVRDCSADGSWSTIIFTRSTWINTFLREATTILWTFFISCAFSCNKYPLIHILLYQMKKFMTNMKTYVCSNELRDFQPILYVNINNTLTHYTYADRK